MDRHQMCQHYILRKFYGKNFLISTTLCIFQTFYLIMMEIKFFKDSQSPVMN